MGTEVEHVEENCVERSVVVPSPIEFIGGRLRACLPVWKEMVASPWVVRVLSEAVDYRVFQTPTSRVSKSPEMLRA